VKLKRGHLYTADLNPRFGTEAGKLRPVLVLQTDLMNDLLHPSTLICLLTSQTRLDIELLRVHLHKGEGGLDVPSDIMMDQLRAIDNRCFRKELGHLSSTRLSEVEEKIKIVLDL